MNTTTRLAIVCTHPIQYYAPVFAQLARRSDLEIRVFYGWKGLTDQTLDPEFGQKITWDIPLLEGYEFEFVDNVAKAPGSHHYSGIDSRTLVSRIESWKADVVLVYGWCYKAHLQVLRYFRGRIPVFFRGDSTLLGERPGWRRIARRWFLWWVYRHIDVALYVGTNNYNYFRACGLKPDQLAFAPHAIDNSRFDATNQLDNVHEEKTREAIRSELRVSEDQILIIFVGKLDFRKSPRLLISAFHRLESGKAHLAMVGSGPLQPELENSAGQNVHFVGFKNQREMPMWYRAADVVVLPSVDETWGLVLNEGMAAGKPVIASDHVGAAVDLISPGRNGWICEAGKLESLANCLNSAVAKGVHGLSNMGIESKKIIQDWSVEIQAERIAVASILATTKHV